MGITTNASLIQHCCRIMENIVMDLSLEWIGIEQIIIT